MRSRPLALALVLTFATASGLGSPAYAEGSSTNAAAADAAFEQGRTLLAQQRLAEACEKLEESDRLRPSGRAALNLADCFERRGMIASAHARFLDAAQRAVEAHRVDAEQHARARAARLEARLPRVVIVVLASDDVAGLQITHQGRPLPRSAWNVPATVDPGTVQTYEGAAPGKTFHATFTAEEGKTHRVELHLVDDPRLAAPVAGAPPLPVPPPVTPPSDHPNVGAYAALGAGTLGLGLGIFSGLQVLSSKSTVAEHCAADRTCDVEGASAATRGRTYAVLSPVGFGVGAVGIGLGTYLLLRNGKTEVRRSASSLTVAPSAGHTSAGFTASGKF